MKCVQKIPIFRSNKPTLAVLVLFCIFGSIESASSRERFQINPDVRGNRIIGDYQMLNDWRSDESLCDEFPHEFFALDYKYDGIGPNEAGVRCEDKSEVFTEVLDADCSESLSNGSCNPETKAGLPTTVRDALGRIADYEEIPVTCIASAMREGIQTFLPKKAGVPMPFFHCESSNANESSKEKSLPTCLTKPVIQYIHWVLNHGIKCASTGADLNVFTPQEVFAMLFHESRLIYNVDKKVGMGLMQLRPDGAKDMEKATHPSRRIWDKIKDAKPQCKAFHGLFDEEVATYSAGGKEFLRDCPFAGPDEGIKRAVMTGLMLLRSNIEMATDLVKVEWFVSEGEYKKAIRYLSRTLYNRGYGNVSHNIKKIEDGFKGKLSAEEFTLLSVGPGRTMKMLREHNTEHLSQLDKIEKAIEDGKSDAEVIVMQKQMIDMLVRQRAARERKFDNTYAGSVTIDANILVNKTIESAADEYWLTYLAETGWFSGEVQERERLKRNEDIGRALLEDFTKQPNGGWRVSQARALSGVNDRNTYSETALNYVEGKLRLLAERRRLVGPNSVSYRRDLAVIARDIAKKLRVEGLISNERERELKLELEASDGKRLNAALRKMQESETRMSVYDKERSAKFQEILQSSEKYGGFRCYNLDH